MGGIINTIKQVLELEMNDEYFVNLDRIIIRQKIRGVTEEDLDILFNFMEKMVVQKPNARTLLLLNRVVNEIKSERRTKFLELYSIFLKQSNSERLKNEVRWFMNYQHTKIKVN